MADTHSQGVVAADGGVVPDGDAGAHAHEHRAQEGGRQGHFIELGPQAAELLEQGVGKGEASRGHGGMEDELPPQELPAQQVAGHVHHEIGDGRGDAEPMLQQQVQAQGTALGDPGEGMDVIKAKGQEDAGEKDDDAGSWIDLGTHGKPRDFKIEWIWERKRDGMSRPDVADFLCAVKLAGANCSVEAEAVLFVESAGAVVFREGPEEDGAVADLL